MRIGIIGSGNVGGTLGRRWAERGHEIMFGSRDPSSNKIQSLLEQINGKAKAGTLSDAAVYGEVLVLATPWPATERTLSDLGDLSGKIIFDCTNPLKPDFSLDVGHSTSGAEQVALWADGARIVKVFNTTGYGNMADPSYDGQKATMFFAGDDHVAKSKAARLAEQIGFEAVDAGPLSHARLLEPMAVLWIYLAHAQGMGTGIAFQLLRRPRDFGSEE